MNQNRKVSHYPDGSLVLLHDSHEIAMVLFSNLSAYTSGREYCVLVGEERRYYFDDELGLLADEMSQRNESYIEMKALYDC